MPNLKIPTPLRPYVGGQSTLALSGLQVSDVLEAAVEEYPELKKHLFNEENQLRPFVNLFLGEDNINQLQGLDTKIGEADTLLIIPSIAGGKES
jgi:molybdopterin converting factor small subunit